MKRNIFSILVLTAGLLLICGWSWADKTKPDPYIYPTTYWDTCQSYTPVDWRSHQYTQTGLYYDTVVVAPDTTLYIPADTTITVRYDSTFHEVTDTIPVPSDTINVSPDTLLIEPDTMLVKNPIMEEWDTLIITGKDTSMIAPDTLIVAHDTIFRPRIDTIVTPLNDTTITPEIIEIEYYADTIYTLDLTVDVPHYLIKQIDLPRGSSVDIRGKKYNQEGEYWDTIPNLGACDSIIHIIIRWTDTFHQYDTLSICSGNHAEWRGKTLTAPGNYYDSLKTVHNQDSIYQLHLIVHPIEHTYDSISVCPDQIKSYRWRGKQIFTAGDYSDTLVSQYGCDSILHLHLEVPADVPITTIEQDYCQNEGYVFRGTRYFTQKTFTDTLIAKSGCDSIVEYVFHPLPYFFHEDILQHFEGESVQWRGQTYSQDGVYQDTLKNIYGCDSIYQLRVVTKYENYRTINRCEGDTVMIKKLVVERDTTVYDSLKTMMGGDSIIQYRINFSKKFYTREKFYLCSNEYIKWDNHKDSKGNPIILHEAGLYYARYKTVGGCDSTYEVEVIQSPAYLKDSVVIICNDSNDINPVTWTDSKGKKWEFHKHNLDTTIIDTMRHTIPDERHYTIDDHLPISGGCDSIFRFRVIITDRCSELDLIAMCRGEKVEVDGRIYDKPGLYSNKMPSKLHPELGLPDSTHTFRIYIVDPDTAYDTLYWCESNLPVIYNGKKYTSHQSGNYDIHLKNMYQCDSLVHLRINIIPTVFSPINTYEFCPGEFISVHSNTGKVYTHPGDYNDTVHVGIYGCDSIIRTRIVVKDGYLKRDSAYINPGETYRWKGHHNDTVYTQAGVYYDSLKNRYGCDSVYMIRLIYPAPYYDSTSTYVCSNEYPLHWRNKQIYDEGVYYDSLFTIHKLDSVYVLKVETRPYFDSTSIIRLCSTDYFKLHDRIITTSGVYSDTLHRANTCDSIINYIVNFTSLSIANMETLRCAEGSSITWRSKTFSKEGYYFDTIRTDIGCDSIIYRMHLLIEHPFLNEISITTCTNNLPYEWRGQYYDKPGTYDDSLLTNFGLDSIYRLHLTVDSAYFASITVAICKDSSFNFGNQVITEPGIYFDKQYKTDGCDSITRCVVNRALSYLMEETMSYVHDEELPLSWHGKDIPGEGYYYDSLWTQECGCDSVHRLHVVKKQSYFFFDEDNTCDDQLPYTWRGQSLYETGIYEDKYTTIDGLDSVYQFRLTVNASRFQTSTVELCKGQIYSLHGIPLSEPGLYRDTMLTEDGCHDITEVIIRRPEETEVVVNHILCHGESILINGKDITEAGNYYETTQSLITGCDSVTHHIVVVGKTFFQDETQTINAGSSYEWHKNGMPVTLTEAGTYFDSCLTTLGCDSIYRLTLTVNNTSYIFPTEQVTICETEVPYTWQNQSLYKSGFYTAAYKTQLGLDSIYSLQLVVDSAYDSIVHLNYCDGERPVLNGILYTRSAAFTDTLTSESKCDSVRIHYIINFHQRYSTTKLIQLNNGETYLFGDTIIATSGVYFRHFLSEHGCDSLVTLRVTACSSSHETVIKKDFCDGEIFIYNRDTITSSCVLHTSLTTESGCDSLITYIINFHSTFNDFKEVSVCPGEGYRWTGHYNDTVLYKQGLYIDSVPTGTGCYDTYSIHLKYKKHSLRDTVIDLCEDALPYIYKGKKYYTDSVFMDTLSNNIEGCDSILRWHYNINRHCSAYDNYNHCIGETMYIEGLLIDHSGVYSVNRITPQGEDSLYRFIVHDVHPYEVFTPIGPLCDSITYKGKTYYARGEGKESFQVDLSYKTVDGCDSIEHLLLTIPASSPKNTHYATIADYETYRFENKDYKAAGTYPVHHLNKHNCDSTEELVLTVLKTTYMDPVEYTFCEGSKDGIEIFGKMYHPTFDTVISDTSRVGNTPVIRTAVIHVNHPFVITSFDEQPGQEICSANELVFYVQYRVRDARTMPDTYEVDFYTGELGAMPKHQSYPVNGKTTLPIYMDGQGTSVTPGYYDYRVTLHSESCAQSDTSFHGQVLVRYPAEVMAANWNNMIALYNEEYNAGRWKFCPPYTWQIWSAEGDDKTALINPHDKTQPYIASNDLKEGDVVVATLMREGYTRAIPSCPFVFVPTLFNGQHPILVYPTMVPKARAVTVETTQDAEYELLDNVGHRYRRGTLRKGSQSITVPGVSGCYFLHVHMNDGSYSVERVLVY